MIQWLANNLSTIIVGTILLLIMAAIIVTTIKNKKKGNSFCRCNCSGCSMSSHCQSRADKPCD